MDATTRHISNQVRHDDPNPLVHFLGRQRRPRGKFDETRLVMTRATAVERFWWCVARARGEFNSCTNAMRLVDGDGSIVAGVDGRVCAVDLAAERRAKKARRLELAGGVEGVLERELGRTVGAGAVDSVIGGRIDVVG